MNSFNKRFSLFFIKDNHVIQQLSPQVPPYLSTNGFCHGVWLEELESHGRFVNKAPNTTLIPLELRP
jgi:hypothetical protein